MQRLVFWLVYPILWLISILPFPIFYLVSDVIFFLVYYVIGYRRKTVRGNLKLVFPEKKENEIKQIEKKFYRHMVDMFLEMIKSISISNAELKKRFIFTNPEELKRLYKLDKSIIAMCGHYASYEWMIALQLYGIKYRAFGIYKKVKNPYFDRLARRVREKFDGELIAMQTATSTIAQNERNNIAGIYAMVADQSPKRASYKSWADFMGIKVPFYLGSENLAREFDMAVIYLQVEKIKRGHYQATLVNITDHPKEEPEYFITRRFADLLEKQIRTAPEYYLWTHKRWKHRNAPIPRDAGVF